MLMYSLYEYAMLLWTENVSATKKLQGFFLSEERKPQLKHGSDKVVNDITDVTGWTLSETMRGGWKLKTQAKVYKWLNKIWFMFHHLSKQIC